LSKQQEQLFFKKYHAPLFNCNKPYQYVGGEFLSANKDFEKAQVHYALAFPDKYEIGISNLGLRVLYDRINSRQDFMADRVYAPEKDFHPGSLYALESKRPLKDFDAIGFSLQYELAYPTVLKMLEMAEIPYRNDERGEDDPIIMAGGPCAFNPLPMADFIDVFMIGDGEDSIVEACEILQQTKGLPRKERIKTLVGANTGRWSACAGGTVTKRIAQLDYETAPKSYPIPFSSGVHDRAIVEIRRGCGRMCRFCQPGHVTLPVRERPAEDIIKIAKELVKNTGYDEYSLLSLSSNDYSNIKEVIKELAVGFDEKKVSVSLPSQRIDGFNLELANLVQSVRKSTMTLAPEAGSQRLRDVIKKNISEEQIVDAALTLYENGWARVKFYFICGLPTETLADMDEMAALLSEIKYRAKLLKKEKGLNHGFDITCTLSIFVPKPFTPFQWHAQMPIEKVMEHIHYLKDKTRHIKGLKINYHDKFVSQVEAVLTRGSAALCGYIEALYKKGCYLDAWDENFERRVWEETANECGIDLKELAQKTYSAKEALPWDFINTGIDKEWLVNEYRTALSEPEAALMQADNIIAPTSTQLTSENELGLSGKGAVNHGITDVSQNFNPAVKNVTSKIVSTCQSGCVNCGVCKNLNTKKVMARDFTSQNCQTKLPPAEPTAACKPASTPSGRYRIKLTKTGILRYFSHLDWQNTFFKAIARSDLKTAFSQGFNPTMKISMGIALPLFAQSECEFVDIELQDDISAGELKLKLEEVLPEHCRIISAVKIDRSAPAIDHTAAWAEYKVQIFDRGVYSADDLIYNTGKVLSSEEIFVEKKNKKGLTKKIDIKPSVKSYRFQDECLFIVLKTGQGGVYADGTDMPAALRADVLMEQIAPGVMFDITRIRFFDREMTEL
jgi:radical SAM-linked protein